MSLQVWLPLDGSLRNLGISGNSLSLAAGQSFVIPGKTSSQCLKTSTNQDLLYNGNQMSTTSLSFGGWFKFVQSEISSVINGLSYTSTASIATGQLIGNNSYGGISLQWNSNNIYSGGSFSSMSVQAYLRTSTVGAKATSSYAIPFGQWVHIFLVCDKENLKCSLYINGALFNSFTFANFSDAPSRNLHINYKAIAGGNGPSANIPFYCNDVRIYNHALSTAEVKEISQGLILHYKLDDELINYKTNLAHGATCGTAASAASPSVWGGHKAYTVLKSTNEEGVPFSQKSVMTIIYDTSVGTGGGASVYPPTSFKVKPSTTYIYSRYIKASDDFVYTHANFLYRYEYQSTGGTRLIEGGVFNKNNRQYVGNGWYRCWGTFTTQTATAYLTLPFYTYPGKNVIYELGGLQLEETSLSPYVAGIDNCINPNLVIGLTAGGRTTISGITVTTTGENADTYFYLNLSAAMIKNHTYKLSCEASGLANKTYLNFPIAGQGNTTIPSLKIQNGYNETIFRANDACVNAGVKVILDDNGGTRTTVITMTNFRLVDITPIVQDSSGYNHNGYLVGEYSVVDSVRYNKCLKFNSTAVTTSSEQGLSFLSTNFGLTTPLQLTFTWWANPESGYGGSTGHAALCTSSQALYPSDYNTTAFHHRDSGFDIYPSDSSGVKRLSFTYTQNAWHHYAITYDGTTAKAYQDGILKTSVEVGTNKTLASFTKIFWGFSYAGGVWRKTVGTYSDIRIYCTALLETDIKQLYNVSMKIDNKWQIHTFELCNKSTNLLRSELIMPTAKAGYTSRIGEITVHNNAYAYNIAPAPFYKNISDSESGILKGQFIANTSYILDMWIDVDSVVYNGNNVSGGMTICYTDGTSDNTFVLTGGNKGYQHKILITPSNKTIDRLNIYYYTSTDVFYRVDSYIGAYTKQEIKKTGLLNTSNLSEIDNITQFVKGGHVHTKQIIER